MRGTAAAALFALPFVPFLAGWTPQGIPGAALLAAAGLLAPGAVGVLWAGRTSAAAATTAALLVAFLLNLGTIAVLRATGADPDPARYATVLGVLTVAAAVAALGRSRALPALSGAALAVGAAAFLLFAFSGTRVVPPLEDQDFEVQATANGLVRELNPVCLTNRSRLHFFAHPPLLHFWSAATLTLAGQLDDVRPAYDAAVAERAKAPPERGAAAAVRAFRDPPPLPDRGFLWATEVFPAFKKAPALLGTRAPNFLLGALVTAMIFAWVRRLGAAPLDAGLVAAAYATLPEVFVRSGYGGYYAGTAALLLTGAWLASERGASRGATFTAGVLAALVNHKTVLLGAAAAACTLGARKLAALRGGAGVWLIAGLVAGSAVFWAWGLAVAPADFVGEHVRDHGLERFAGGEVVSRSGEAVYPSRAGVWLEFARNMGWAWFAMAGAALVWGVRRSAGPDAEDGGPRQAALLVLWVLFVAAAFTLTDWRQTKHLCLAVPALSVLIGAMAAAAAGRTRLLLRAGLAGAVVWNGVWIVRLARDFDALTVTPLW